MALRTSIRLLALATVPLSCLLWDLAGPLPALAGLGLVLLYLVLLAGEGDLTRWQLRYHLTPGDDIGRLEQLCTSWPSGRGSSSWKPVDKDFSWSYRRPSTATSRGSSRRRCLN
jgi:hypothetical protein